jgi:hypothetical protein
MVPSPGTVRVRSSALEAKSVAPVPDSVTVLPGLVTVSSMAICAVFAPTVSQ